MKQIEATLKWTKVGQKHAYGDFHRECEIHTKEELTNEDILSLTEETGKMEKSIFDSKALSMPLEEYFRGYYTIEKTPYGYYYHGVEPYDD